MSTGARLLRRWLHPLRRSLETSVHPLRYLFLEITQRCNLRCRHCGSDCVRDTRLDELSTAEWLSVLRGLGARFDRREVALVVTGGEPLCRPDLDRLLEGLRDSGFVWGMVTNGWALGPRTARHLVRHRVSSVTVSLDGLEATHDWLRGVPGSCRRARDGIAALLDAGVPYLDVVTCVAPRTLPELPAVHRLLRELGVPGWRLFSIFPKGRAREDGELLLPPEGLRALLGFVREVRAGWDGAPPAVSFSCEGYLPRGLDEAVREEPYFCRAGINIASILCDGSIAACPNVVRSLVQGNVRTDDLADVWEHRFRPFRRRDWMRSAACGSCGEWERCLGNSLHLWDDEAGSTACCTWDVARGGDGHPPRRPPG